MLHGKETATVWFNGPSAKALHGIPPQPLEIGCNFISTNRKVHHVCAYDIPVMKEIEKAPMADVKYWTRRKMATPVFKTFKSEISFKHYRNISGFCSGTLALIVALHHGAKQIDLLGCDWLITNKSMYDDAYIWRDHYPNKTSKDKLRLLENISRMVPLRIIHDNVRPELGKAIEWVSLAKYLDSVNSNP